MPTQPQFRSHPTGSPFNTWVESSNVEINHQEMNIIEHKHTYERVLEKTTQYCLQWIQGMIWIVSFQTLTISFYTKFPMMDVDAMEY